MTISPPTSGGRGPQLIPARIATNPWVVLLVLTLGFFMILLDTTIVNIAIPNMERSLNASFDSILWVLNGYILVYAVLLITAGRLGDTYGPKRMFIIGLVVFTLASLACGFSHSADQLILFRVVQGVGGAILTPQTLSMLPHIFPPERRGAAFGIWGAVSGLAAVVGPVLGGFLVTNYDWQSIFYVNVPVGIVAVVAAIVLMPEVRSDTRHDFDLPGIGLASAGLLLLVYAIIEGQKYAWGPINSVGAFSIGPTRWSLVSIYSLILYALVILAAFVWVETRVAEPLLPLSLFHDRNFTVSNIVGSAVGFAIFSLFIPFTLFLQTVLGFSAIHAGLTGLPVSLGLMVAAPLSGRLSDRVNGKWIVMFGLIVAALGVFLLVHSLALDNTSWSLTLPLLVTGVGMGCTFAPLVTLALRDVNPALSGVASGFISTTRQVAGAIGAAVVGATLSNQIAGDLPKQAARFATELPLRFRPSFVAAFHAASRGSQDFGAGQPHGPRLPPSVPASTAHQISSLAIQVFDHAFLDGTRPALGVVIAGLVAGAIGTAWMRGGRSAADARHNREREPAPETAEVVVG